MHLPITLTIAAALVVIYLWHFIRCVRLRYKFQIAVGHSDNPLMEARMRAHANFTETAPLFLILLALDEAVGGTEAWLWYVGLAFVIARIAHAFGMERPAPNPYRAVGMLGTVSLMLTVAVYAVVLSYARTGPTMIG